MRPLPGRARVVRRIGDGLRELVGRQARSNRDEGVTPEKIAWIFCTGRSGSTRLASMLGDLPGWEVWNEPLVGALFGEFYEARAHRTGQKAFVMGDPYRSAWLASVRDMVLRGAEARHPGPLDFLAVKEPHGTMGAPLLSDALPESRLVCLVRDPRDVVSSALDAQKRGSWAAQAGRRKEGATPADRAPDAFVKRRAELYLRDIGKALEAYEQHGGPKSLLRYEDLTRDTVAEMRRVCAELGVRVGDEDVRGVVRKHSWENIPDEKKGAGKFYRKGGPGGWREDLTPEQAHTVERTTAMLLGKFYPTP